METKICIINEIILKIVLECCSSQIFNMVKKKKKFFIDFDFFQILNKTLKI